MKNKDFVTNYIYEKYSLNLPKTCYLPSDDTFLLLDTLKKEITNNNKYNKALELGFGSGVISLYIYDFVNNIDCSDINLEVINYFKEVKKKYNLEKINVIHSDLFENISNKYDLIIFNPPYVPSEEINRKDTSCLATDGGTNGTKIINKFINNLNKVFKKESVCYLLISSLNNIKDVEKLCKENNFRVKIINRKKLFFEELIILKITK